jgi:Bacterial inner membrane protein
MSTELLVHGTGLVALALNVLAMVRRCERRLRIESSLAGFGWALNNLLLGAHTAAALSVVSASRTATAGLSLDASACHRRRACLGFMALTLGAGLLTFSGWLSLLVVAASLLSTYAMFYLRGRPLRWVLVLVSVLWMHSAWANDSAEQIAANVLSAAAALWGACREERFSPTTLQERR